MKCSLETRCKECRSWSKEFMLGDVKHQSSLVSKGRKPVTTSSPSEPVTAVTTAPVFSLPSLHVSEDQFREYVHSVLQNMLSQSDSVGTNPISTAPTAVPDLAPMSTGVAGGLRSVTPVEVPSTESSGVVLPTCQEDLPLLMCLCLPSVARSGDFSLGGSFSSGHSQSHGVLRGMDQLRVVDVAPSAIVTVASVLSPGSLCLSFLCFLFSFAFSSSSCLLFFFCRSFVQLGPSSSLSSFSFASSPSSFFSVSFCFCSFLSYLFLFFGFRSSSFPWFPSSSSSYLGPSPLFLFALWPFFFFVLPFPSLFPFVSFGGPYGLSDRLFFFFFSFFLLVFFFCLFLVELRCVSGFGFRFVS